MDSPTPTRSKGEKSEKDGKSKTPKHPTWEFPEGSGIRIARIPNKHGGAVFGFSYQIRIPGELLGKLNGREILQRKTKDAAERLAADRFTALRAHGTQFSQIPPDIQQQALVAWGVLKEHNDQQPAKLQLNLVDVVKAGIRALNPVGGRKTVAEVAAEMTASKTERCASGGLDPTSLHDFKTRSGRLTDEFGPRLISEVTHVEIEDFLKKLKREGSMYGGPLTRRSVLNYRNVFAEIFRHAKARQYCADNPFERFTKEDLKSLGGERAIQKVDEISILTLAEVRQLLNAACSYGDAGHFGALILRLFCGVRTSEVCQLSWEHVHWVEAQPYVHVPASIAKKRRIRHIEIPANALLWLKLCNPPATGRLIPGTGDKKKDLKNYCNVFNRLLVKDAGIGHDDEQGYWESEWDNNATRHSFGSYHYAMYGDALKTAGQMGHKQGDDVLFAHYRTLVKKTEGEQYFAIIPDATTDNVTPFPVAAGSTEVASNAQRCTS